MQSSLSARLTVALMAGIFAVGSEELVVSPLLGAIAGSFDVSVATAGLSVTVYGLATAFGALGFAPLSDRLDRRLCLLGGLALFVLGTVTCAVAPGVWVFMAGRALAGLATGVFVPTAYAFVGDSVRFEDRARTMGVVVSAWSLSLVLGVPVGAMVGGWLGWRMVFWLLALLGLAVAALLLAGGARPAPDAATPDAAGSAAADVVPDPAELSPAAPAARGSSGLLAALVVVTFLNMLGFYGMYTYVGTALNDRFGSGDWTVGVMILVYGLGFATTSVTGSVADRLGKDRTLTILLGALVVVLAGLPAAMGSSVVLPLVLFVWGAAQSLTVTLLSTLLSEAAPSRRGATMALYSLATNLAVAAGAAALGLVFEAVGFVGVGLTSAAVTGVALVLVLAVVLPRSLRPAPPAPQAEAPTDSLREPTT